MGNHPYILTPGNLTTVVERLRSNFQTTLSVDVLQKLQLAKSNERHVLGTLQFLGVYDSSGKKTPAGEEAFSKHKDEDFQEAFAKLVQASYKELFTLHKENAWNMTGDDLISYFRASDKLSNLTAKRQALAFSTMAAIAGKRKAAGTVPRSAVKRTPAKDSVGNPAASKATRNQMDREGSARGETGTDNFKPSVHIDVQIHISPESSKEQIDLIFASMRKHLFESS